MQKISILEDPKVKGKVENYKIYKNHENQKIYKYKVKTKKF